MPAARPGWLRRTFYEPARKLLLQGLSPEQLALTIALGVACGLVPMIGLTTLFATTLSWRLRLNMAAMLLVGHLTSPLQLLLFMPFFHWGAQLLGHQAATHFTLAQIRHLLTHPTWAAVGLLWRASLGALLIWAVAMVPLTFLLYRGLRPLLQRLLERLRRRQLVK